MKTLPRLEFWSEPIDGVATPYGERAIARHCCRRWDSEPRYSVFAIRTDHGWESREKTDQELERRLRKMESALMAYYGRHWLRQWQDEFANKPQAGFNIGDLELPQSRFTG